jgi:hypothetical protein
VVPHADIHNHQSIRPPGTQLGSLPPQFLQSRVRAVEQDEPIQLTRRDGGFPLFYDDARGEQRLWIQWKVIANRTVCVVLNVNEGPSGN